MDTAHNYKVTARWTGDRTGIAKLPGIPASIVFAAPPEFKGPGGKWTPEHFLVAAVASCFVVTFRGIAELSKLEFLDLDLEAQGELRKQEAGWGFTEIILWPILTIFQEEDRERGMRILEKAERSCLVARALAFPVTMEPVIKTAAEVLAC